MRAVIHFISGRIDVPRIISTIFYNEYFTEDLSFSRMFSLSRTFPGTFSHDFSRNRGNRRRKSEARGAAG